MKAQPRNPNDELCPLCIHGRVRGLGQKSHCSEYEAKPEVLCTKFRHYRHKVKSHQRSLRR